MKRPLKKRHPIIIAAEVLALIGVVALIATAFFRPWIPRNWAHRIPIWQPVLWQRPEGMAPAAFQAFMRACKDTEISSARIGQTMGNHPLSVGYHKRDGFLWVDGQRIEYCAAVDLGANDMDRTTLNRFLANLTKQGFTCWYREKGHWRGREHIHAVYTQLPMKSQLRGQVRLFLKERRNRGQPPWPWEQKLRKTGLAITYPKRRP